NWMPSTNSAPSGAHRPAMAARRDSGSGSLHTARYRPVIVGVTGPVVWVIGSVVSVTVCCPFHRLLGAGTPFGAAVAAGSSRTAGRDSPPTGDHIMGDVSGYLSIGDFSRATHMSVKTLRHYHQIGLLEPAEVDAHTGYRHYGTEQIPT